MLLIRVIFNDKDLGSMGVEVVYSISTNQILKNSSFLFSFISNHCRAKNPAKRTVCLKVTECDSSVLCEHSDSNLFVFSLR
jgi:hypothetical protein